ncbi:hypothetical protein EDC96DRAFT_440893 [Choanephora cucurbitarum]|nr:hypothetical protein EDC96DRAFT_440893 [Choanephora cucurbitarum]
MHISIAIIAIAILPSTAIALTSVSNSKTTTIYNDIETSPHAASYLAPFASNDAIEKPYELIDDHEDLIQKRDGTLVSLRKRGDDCEKYHKVSSHDNCISVAKSNGISVNQFYDMNPSIHRGSCDNLLTGGTYCVKESNSSRFVSNKVAKKKLSARKKSSKRKKTTKKKKLLQKGSALTYYWIAHPDDYEHSGKQVTIKTCDGKSLGTVAQKYADALVMEGTGIVGDKIINLGGCTCRDYQCFMEVDKKEDPYGLTAYGGPLRPFITIAANDIKRDTKIFVPEIVGWEIPGSAKKHNGCLLVDDQSWSFDKNHIDLYVYREKHYRTLNSEHKVSKVNIYEGGDCHLLNYE